MCNFIKIIINNLDKLIEMNVKINLKHKKVTYLLIFFLYYYLCTNEYIDSFFPIYTQKRIIMNLLIFCKEYE